MDREASLKRQPNGSVTDPQHFRRVLGHYPTGVALVSGLDEDGSPIGMVVGSFTSVSLDPPLVAFLPSRSSSTFARLSRCATFVVSVLADDQEELCRSLAQKDATDKWSSVSWRPARSGAPIVEGAVAWMECDLEDQRDAGDHLIVVGRVRELDVGTGGLPLLFFQGGYGRFSPGALVARPEADLLPAVRLADMARAEMEGLARDTGLECLAQARVGDELVVVASAGSPGTKSTRVGVRVPFAAPLGAVLAAWADAETVDAWASRSLWNRGTDPGTEHRDALARIRQRGYSAVLAPHYPPVHAAMDAFSGEGANPPNDTDLERALGTALGEAGGRYEPEHLPGAGPWEVRSLAVPVLGSGDQVQLALRLYRLPPHLDRDTFARVRDRLLAAAEAVSRRVQGERSSS